MSEFAVENNQLSIEDRNGMRTARLFSMLIVLCSLVGCQSARYVLRSENEGIVAIPSNSTWPVNHREHAEELMQQHFPEGYVIEQEEEVVVGQVTQTHHHQSGNQAKEKKNKVFRQSGHSTTTTTDQTEYRISYRKADPADRRRALFEDQREPRGDFAPGDPAFSP